VVNQGSTGIDVTAAGIEIDVGTPRGLSRRGSSADRGASTPSRTASTGRSTGYWYVDAAAVVASVTELAKQTHLAPVRFRPFAALVDDTCEAGEWRSVSYRSGRKT
jgi:hypothetical protein